METQKIVSLLNSPDNYSARFATKKWYIIDIESDGNYSKDEEIKFLTRSIESSLCNYSDAYILVTGNITTTPNTASTQVIFKIVHDLKNIEQVETFMINQLMTKLNNMMKSEKYQQDKVVITQVVD